jgi:hypothetical protein
VARIPSSSEHPRPSPSELAALSILAAVRRALPPLAWHAILPGELEELEAEIRQATAEALSSR